MSELDANIIVDGQKSIAATKIEGEIIKSGGEIDATCSVQDSDGKKHLAIKVFPIESEESSKNELAAQVLTNDNELAVVMQEQEGSIISENENDFNCLVETENNEKQKAVKTIILEGTLIKSGGAIDTTCLVETENGKQLALKTLGLSGGADWKQPSDWSDIRKGCPANAIALYAGHTADYSQYDNLGFTATCVGGYNVFIDGTQYGTTYASGAQCSITWSSLALDTGDNITTPTALKAHKIWISPATEGNDITAFKCARVAESGTERQGLLWAHFNLTNQITPAFLAGRSGQYTNTIAKAITAKNNVLNVSSSINSFVFNATALEYIPVIDGNNETANCASSFAGSGVSKITIKNFKMHATNSTYLFYNSKVQEIVFNNVDTSAVSNFTNFFGVASNLKKLPSGMDYSSATTMLDFLQNNTSLQDTILDVSAATGLTRLGCYGTTAIRFISGFKGLRVSNEAPFNDATAPQINVQYTGMDRNALVQLFNDLPTVSDGQIINVTGTIGSEDLTGDDVMIAINKGWTVTGGPAIAHTIVSGFSASNYGVIPVSGIGNADTWSISLRAKTGNSVSSQGQHILSGNGAVYSDFGITNGYWNLFLSSNGSSWDITGGSGAGQNVAAKTNTEYLLNLSFTGTKYIFKVSENNGTTWTTVDEVTSSTKVYNVNSFKFGNTNDNYWPWGNWLDLTSLKIVFDGTTVFDGMSASINTNYNVVGNLIMDNNIFSNFAAGNYLIAKSSLDFQNYNSWTIEGQITTPNTFRDSRIFSCGISDFTTPVLGIGPNGRLVLWLSSNGSSWNICTGDSTYDPNPLSTNTAYDLRLIYDGEKYKLFKKLATESDYGEAVITVNNSTKLFSNSNTKLSIGKSAWAGYYNDGQYFNGSINMNKFKVVANDNVISDYVFPDYPVFDITGTLTIETQYV